MNNPVVSIITPSFNRADIIHETAASIFNQTYPFWEWIITDDGSTDNSWEVLNEFAAKDNRVKIYKREKELKGACACRNISVEKSGGDYLIFLDTDDLLASFCLEQRVKAMQEDSKCDFIIFPMLLF
ncbi:MAG TPA: glycosyltransferase family A protein, partial [Chitinophagaceae bacterium]